MLTPTECQHQIDRIIEEAALATKKRERSLLQKQVEFWTAVKMYLLSDPSEDFVIKELRHAEMVLANIERDFPVWMRAHPTCAKDERQLRSEYNVIKELDKHKSHLKTIKAILQI